MIQTSEDTKVYLILSETKIAYLLFTDISTFTLEFSFTFTLFLHLYHQVFPADEVCPKDHVKISGVSICMKKRDVCKKCPPQVKIDQNECPNGKVVLERDTNGCQVYR